ncbi:MAG TPA: hypothetical protein VD902_04820 [Symbiobacteriaceae bacterium]|nr:hypothetical protein [Symbiobacteriaceae bacterium]
MPRWARFLSCSFTGLLLAVVGFLVAAYWWEGDARYWQAAVDFAASPAFWYLTAVFALLMAVSLVVARLAVRLYRMPSVPAGVLSGALVALGYTLFLVSTHADTWGGVLPGLYKLWPAAAVFAAPFALSAGFTAWLWERLD